MKLRFHRLVQREVNEAVRWYEEQRAGLGDDLFAKLTGVLDEIAERPEGHAFWLGSGTIRRAKLKRFPYAVLYEIRPGKVRVLCVRHNKRHPAYGMGRD
jgi:plasmid stabilization system protein ParE